MNTSGYVLIDRERNPDLAVQYPSVERARVAITEDLLIDGFCEEDAIDARVPDENEDSNEFLQDREVILSNDY